MYVILRIENHKYLRFATGFLTLGGNLLRVNVFFLICVCDTQTQIRLSKLKTGSCSFGGKKNGQKKSARKIKMAYVHQPI